MTDGIKDKIVVVTGASSGLGKATARLLSAAGATVVLGARRADRLRMLAKELETSGNKALAVTTDVSQCEQVRALVDAAVRTYGRVDVMINNAGLMPQAPLERLKVDEWDRMIDVNLKGVLYGIAAALPHSSARSPVTSSTFHRLPATGSGPASRSTRRRSSPCARCRKGCAKRSSRTTSGPPSFHRARSRPSFPTPSLIRTHRSASGPSMTRSPFRPTRSRGRSRSR
jgi:NAD(P)-dependent dehydrogenase (short-subunit alcohol dehydrogenase family)